MNLRKGLKTLVSSNRVYIIPHNCYLLQLGVMSPDDIQLVDVLIIYGIYYLEVQYL